MRSPQRGDQDRGPKNITHYRVLLLHHVFLSEQIKMMMMMKIAKTRRWHVTIIIMPTGWTPTAASSTLEEWTRTFSRGQQCICFTITVF